MSTPTVIVGSPIAVASLPTATTPALDDYAILDGETGGTRKILASGLGARAILQPGDVMPISTLPPEIQGRLAGLSAGELVMILLAKKVLSETELWNL